MWGGDNILRSLAAAGLFVVALTTPAAVFIVSRDVNVLLKITVFVGFRSYHPVLDSSSQTKTRWNWGLTPFLWIKDSKRFRMPGLPQCSCPIIAKLFSCANSKLL